MELKSLERASTRFVSAFGMAGVAPRCKMESISEMLLEDPSVENADFEAGITSWQNRLSGYCEASQLLLEDGEGSPHTGEVFAKITKESNSCQSVFSDTSPMQMTLGDKYRFSVYGRANGLKARLAIWACDGDGVQKAIVIENSWTQYSVEYTAGSKVAGKMCPVRVEIYFDGGFGSKYNFDTASLVEI